MVIDKLTTIFENLNVKNESRRRRKIAYEKRKRKNRN